MAKDKIFKDNRFTASPMGAPSNCGVYAICVIKITNKYPAELKSKRVVYIGSSKNIFKRVSNQSHIYRRLFSIVKNYFVVLFYFECEDYLNEEIKLIKKYKPRFNKQHKNG